LKNQMGGGGDTGLGRTKYNFFLLSTKLRLLSPYEENILKDDESMWLIVDQNQFVLILSFYPGQR
jgi:hypothetical protein